MSCIDDVRDAMAIGFPFPLIGLYSRTLFLKKAQYKISALPQTKNEEAIKSTVAFFLTALHSRRARLPHKYKKLRLTRVGDLLTCKAEGVSDCKFDYVHLITFPGNLCYN